jgi:hypothetical protein
MPTAAEIAATQQNQMASALRAGLETLSLDQTITFTKYVRLVLPLDGYVFWVRAGLVSPSAILNTNPLNSAAFNAPRIQSQDASDTITVKGSLHIATNASQVEAESQATNQIIFTSETEVQDLNFVSPQILWIGEFLGQQFAFSARRSYYQQANLHHYMGTAVLPIMKSQIVNTLDGLDVGNVVVSNSLPIWLAMAVNDPPYPWPPGQALPLFPSFLVPENQPLPYGSVHIDPASTQAIQATPWLDRTLGHWQLVEETVTITVYGFRNFNVMDFIDYVYNLTLVQENFGIMDSPVVQDEKYGQAEMDTLAQKKRVSFRINYYQQRARDVARQLILKCIPTFTIVPPAEAIANLIREASGSIDPMGV